MWLKIVTGESIYGKIVIDDITNLTMETRPVTAIIPQMNLFAWNEIQTLGDLERLRLVLDDMPDEALMRTLERRLSKGRDDDPVPRGGTMTQFVRYGTPSWRAPSSSTTLSRSFVGN